LRRKLLLWFPPVLMYDRAARVRDEDPARNEIGRVHD